MNYNPENKDLTNQKLLHKASFRNKAFIVEDKDREALCDYIKNGAIIRLKESSKFTNNVERMTIEIWMDFSEAANGA